MSIMREVQTKMNEALKVGDKELRQVYSNIYNAMSYKAKELRVDEMTEAQEIEVITKLVKQINESMRMCPADRVETLEKMKYELDIVSEYMPKQLDAEEISNIIKEVLSELGIENPTKSDKGNIMKVLMPKVKGKADGKLVNDVLISFLS